MEYTYDDTHYWQDDRIRLRPWEPKDHPHQYRNDMDTTGMTLVQEEVPLPPARKHIDPDGDSAAMDIAAPSFTIETRSGEYVGTAHFNYINERHGTFSIGMVLLAEQRGKGYGKAAMRILLSYAFLERRLHKFSGFCLDSNTASSRMMESLGCTLEGVSRSCVYLHGAYHDQLLYGMLDEEYRRTL